MKSDKASSTAILIARSFVFMAQDKIFSSLISQATLDLSRAFAVAAVGSYRIRLLEILSRLSLARAIVRLLQRLSVPGMLPHFILRKKRLEELVSLSRIELGSLRQLVVLGAGFDTLGARLAAKEIGLNVVEIDHPATQAVKAKAFRGGAIVKPEKLQLIPADLSQKNIEDILQNVPDFSFEDSTLFLAEGVFMYLSLEDVKKALQILNRFPKGKAAYVFTYMLPDDEGRPSFLNQSRLTHNWLRRKNEPFVWGMQASDLDVFLRNQGFHILGHSDAAYLKDRFLPIECHPKIMTAEGENIVWLIR